MRRYLYDPKSKCSAFRRISCDIQKSIKIDHTSYDIIMSMGSKSFSENVRLLALEYCKLCDSLEK